MVPQPTASHIIVIAPFHLAENVKSIGRNCVPVSHGSSCASEPSPARDLTVGKAFLWWLMVESRGVRV